MCECCAEVIASVHNIVANGDEVLKCTLLLTIQALEETMRDTLIAKNS